MKASEPALQGAIYRHYIVRLMLSDTSWRREKITLYHPARNPICRRRLKDTLTQGGDREMVLIGIVLWVLLPFAVAPVVGKLIAIGMDNEGNGGD